MGIAQQQGERHGREGRLWSHLIFHSGALGHLLTRSAIFSVQRATLVAVIMSGVFSSTFAYIPVTVFVKPLCVSITFLLCSKFDNLITSRCSICTIWISCPCFVIITHGGQTENADNVFRSCRSKCRILRPIADDSWLMHRLGCLEY